MTGMVGEEEKILNGGKVKTRTMTTSKMEFFVTIVNSLKPLHSLFTFPFQQCGFETRLVEQPFFLLVSRLQLTRGWARHFIKRRNFYDVISWCVVFLERHSFRLVSGDLPETIRKLCLSTKFPRQELGKINVFFAVKF